MPHTDIARLRGIKTLLQLAAYLRDELDWPIEAGDADAITFDYEAAELGLDENTAVRIKEIKQLRPLTGNQPWGIFFINFEKKRLPVVVMRRILRALVLKKRDAANKSDRQAWQPSDLLFISAYGEESDRAITFAHFVEEPSSGGAAELRVLGWDDDDTPLKYDYVAQVLHEKLRWRGEFERDKEAWRTHWREAFILRHREVVATSKELALALADAAKKIRGRVRAILRYEDSAGEMRKLQRAFQQALIHDLSDDDFADMLAQTVTYGLFSVSVRRTFPGEGTAVTRDDAQHLIFTSPFLKEMMNTFLGVKSRRGKIDFDELGIADVTDLLTSPDTHMEAVLRDFGNKTRGEDPVIHFYELFLTEYDKQKKIQRGVFYTPQPVVSYIVRSVHELLQSEFGLVDGLADTTTWGEMLKKHPGLQLPPLTDEPGEKRSISPDEPFVQILDPATGTATFLVEVIEVIYRTLAAKWKQQRLSDAQQRAAWNVYVPQHLLPRLHAFELMMAPYAIAHMKLGLKLAETGYRFGTEERARIYLTNALEPKVKQLPQIGFDALAHEAAAVNEIKWYKRFTVVLGNPPYAGISSNMTEDAQRAVDAYRTVDGSALNERKIWLQDDYVKFIRKAQTIIDTTTVGVFGYITNHGYLNNPTFRGMRQSLMATFPRMHVLNLHGNANKKEKSPDGSEDKNVFDIRQGVAVCLATRKRAELVIAHADLWGSRESKYAWLATHQISNTSFAPLTPDSPFYFLEPQNVDCRAEYDSGWSLQNVFVTSGVGIVTARDALTIDMEIDALWERVRRFSAISAEQARSEYALGADVQSWKVKWAQEDVKNAGPSRQFIAKILYRPFDSRYIYYTGKSSGFICRPVRDVMRHMLRKGNVGLVTTRSVEIGRGFEHVFCCRGFIQHHTVSLKEVNYLFPLWRGDDTESGAQLLVEGPQSAHNLAGPFLAALSSTLKIPQTDSRGLPNGLTPEDIIHYAYAVLHSPGYRSRYAEFLNVDFPRLPMTGNLELFRALARLGGELTALHLLESPKLAQPITEFTGGRNSEVEKPTWSKNTVWIDKPQTVGFTGVRETVWNFHIGGYQICEKWLKDRKGRTLNKDDIAHYQKIVVALSETIRLMGEIDGVIENHGGWPLK